MPPPFLPSFDPRLPRQRAQWTSAAHSQVWNMKYKKKTQTPLSTRTIHICPHHGSLLKSIADIGQRCIACNCNPDAICLSAGHGAAEGASRRSAASERLCTSLWTTRRAGLEWEDRHLADGASALHGKFLYFMVFLIFLEGVSFLSGAAARSSDICKSFTANFPLTIILFQITQLNEDEWLNDPIKKCKSWWPRMTFNVHLRSSSSLGDLTPPPPHFLLSPSASFLETPPSGRGDTNQSGRHKNGPTTLPGGGWNSGSTKLIVPAVIPASVWGPTPKKRKQTSELLLRWLIFRSRPIKE